MKNVRLDKRRKRPLLLQGKIDAMIRSSSHNPKASVSGGKEVRRKYTYRRSRVLWEKHKKIVGRTHRAKKKKGVEPVQSGQGKKERGAFRNTASRPCPLQNPLPARPSKEVHDPQRKEELLWHEKEKSEGRRSTECPRLPQKTKKKKEPGRNKEKTAQRREEKKVAICTTGTQQKRERKDPRKSCPGRSGEEESGIPSETRGGNYLIGKKGKGATPRCSPPVHTGKEGKGKRNFGRSLSQWRKRRGSPALSPFREGERGKTTTRRKKRGGTRCRKR